jgi:chemotaxis protein MotB
MIQFFKSILRLAFISGALALFISSCSAHKNCGENTTNKKYHSKRYNKALHERDSLCNLTKVQKDELTKLHADYEQLSANYVALQKSTGSELNKLNSNINRLNSDLGNKQATLEQREARLRQLESILRRQDSLLDRLHHSVVDALVGFSPDELTITMRDGKVYVSLSDKLLFKSGDATVEAKGREALKKLAEVLNKNPDVNIAVEGHTDNVPIKTALYKDNWDLSAARATNVVRLLTDEYKMDSRRLTAAGKGEYSPVATNSTVEGKAKNRRTEIVLSPKLEELMKLISM